MAKEVTTIARVPDAWSPKETVYVACDDYSVYVFGHFPDDNPRYEARIGPDGRRSTSRAALPTDVKQSMDELFEAWRK